MLVCYLNTIYKTPELIDKIRSGDLCLVQDEDSLYFVIAEGDFKEKYLSGKIESFFNLSLAVSLQESAGILYRFDGITHRQGNSSIVNSLLELPLSDELHAFFVDILAVLSYKEHSLNVRSLFRLYSIKSSLVYLKCHPHNIPSVENDITEQQESVQDRQYVMPEPEQQHEPLPQRVNNKVIESYAPDSYVFYDYLSDEYKEFWYKLFVEGKGTRESLTILKSKDKNYFNGLVRKFKRIHPDANIYSLKNN